ncbi:C-type mannose receptor 2 isoform X2 [Danio rerio]|nr:L-selectin-like isoform X2 [Danio rerio]|eukprot:XP_017210904.1 L-selectin-like isoform X2 [Danio rerio]
MAWIGLYEDINSWRWSYRNMKIVFSTWSAEEPNNFNGKEACGLTQDGNWNDWNCSILFPFVCLHENGTDRFVFISDAKTWPDAQSYCRQHYTDLAVIQNKLENSLVRSQMKPYSSAWIGLFRDTWKWSDGTNVSTSSFAWPGKQPKMNTLQIPCGVSDSGGLTSYQICSSALPFLCILRAKKQIVRVMVKNIQNRNDPAAMEGIVDWISQMLKKWGLETQTKVTLRIQPDGNVFTLFKKPCKQNMCQSEAAEHC